METQRGPDRRATTSCCSSTRRSPRPASASSTPTPASRRLSLDFLHDYLLGNYRDLYAATLALDINDHNAGDRSRWNLLATAAEASPCAAPCGGAPDRAAARAAAAAAGVPAVPASCAAPRSTTGAPARSCATGWPPGPTWRSTR